MSEWLPLLTAFGLGSVLTSVVQWYFSSRSASRERQYDERKEAYIGLLEAWVSQEKKDFEATTMLDVGHWVLRAQLVASDEVHDMLVDWQDTEPGSLERTNATIGLKKAMRIDLRNY